MFSYIKPEDESLIFTFGTDITELRRVKKQLGDFALFPEMNPGPVLRLDKSGKILLANKTARNLFGEENILRDNWLKICPGLDEEMWQEFMGDHKANIKPECRELYNEMKKIWDKNKDIDNLVKQIFNIG